MRNDPLGYVVCKVCNSPKAIYQGTGKRKNYVYGRCKCGLNNQTGDAIQAQMRAFKPLEEIEAEIEILKNPVVIANKGESEGQSKPNPEPKQSEPEPQPDSQPEPQNKSNPEPKLVGTAACVGIGALVGLVFGGVIKSMKAVA